jgi:hypothetical protein
VNVLGDEQWQISLKTRSRFCPTSSDDLNGLWGPMRTALFKADISITGQIHRIERRSGQPDTLGPAAARTASVDRVEVAAYALAHERTPRT